MKFDDLTINEDGTVFEALQKLNNIQDLSILILFVSSKKDGSIIGSLTDGDIRRSLINDKDLFKKVSKI